MSTRVQKSRQKCCVYFGAEERSEIWSRYFCCSVGPHYPTRGNALSLCDPEPDSLRRTSPNLFCGEKRFYFLAIDTIKISNKIEGHVGGNYALLWAGEHPLLVERQTRTIRRAPAPS